MDLTPCPFCGFAPDIDDGDCLYPVTRGIYDKTTNTVSHDVWTLCCYETGGGCGASILGDNPEDCIKRWETRYEY